MLIVLAQVPEVRGNDSVGCGALLSSLLPNFPLYANLGVIAPDGQLICSAVPATEPTYLGDLQYFQRAVDTGGFVVGEWQIGRVTGEATINCSYPVLDDDGHLLGVVYAALKLFLAQ